LLKAVAALLLCFAAAWLLLAGTEVWRHRGPWSEAFQGWLWAAALLTLAVGIAVAWRLARKRRRRGDEVDPTRR
jgi:uncharacterized membrane protein YphA (DoxX/SURF4 family)